METYKLRPLSKSSPLHTNDSIHKSIRLRPLETEILNTPHLQRLRRLKQLGTSEHTYINANHTRLEHSLGVAHLSEGLLNRIRSEQKCLGISDVDVTCVKIAGLCHDVGHGPYSHIFDGEFRNQMRVAVESGKFMGKEFDVDAYHGIEGRPEGWAHEDDSLMVIDDMLGYLGLGIDEDDLDGPLRQIGDGVDALKFGVVDSTTNKFEVLTSRDWIFIKECIAGGPLPKKGMSIEASKKSKARVEYVGRVDPNKEFLYDVVSNRHSGFDFDKGDYLARDKFYCFGYKGFEQSVLERLFDNACVAWGSCANPKKCFRCKHNQKDACIGEPEAGKHLTICWPQKLMPTVREFFRERFQHHLTIYRHPTTQACSFMVCDILLLADPIYRISTENELDDQQTDNDKILYLPISRANINPHSYWKLDDSILDLIHKSTDPRLRPARQLINRLKSRKLYKLCGEHDIEDEAWERKLWSMKEDEIISEMLELNESPIALEEHYIIIEKRGIHHGMGATDPVSCVRFVHGDYSSLNKPPSELPTAVQIKVPSCLTPKSFLMQTVRVYSRIDNGSVNKQIRVCFNRLIEALQYQAVGDATPKSPERRSEPATFAIEEECGMDDGQANVQNDYNVLTQSPIFNADDEVQSPPPTLGKRTHSESLYLKVTGKSRKTSGKDVKRNIANDVDFEKEC